MVCEPNKWTDNSFGGYLENIHIKHNLITGSNYHNHNLEIREKLYKAVNYLSSIKFGINTQLLNYLDNEGKFLLEDVEFTRSEVLQRFITIKIGQLFSKIPFYLSIHADWRGRLYTQSFFISYQSSDLSTSLLEIWNGEILNESGLNYLYIYGPNNHNQNKRSKKSYIDRINWVKTNYNKIINLYKGIISTADSKFIFAAFCLVIR
uniref:DNA polymerase n=1 Tax=Tricholoma saponaceum TaxID=113602 RepID=A0A6C0W3S7_9AGAR|nr:DNA polymerase [Tricholoma saponaceum]QIC20288.1 DNA polymerase [Tricholoma saponaceum]